MKMRRRWCGTALHETLMVFPIILLTMAVVCDVMVLSTQERAFAEAAYRLLTGGLLAAVLATPAVLIDVAGLPRGAWRRQAGAVQGALQILVLLAFLGSWLLRTNASTLPGTTAIVLSFSAALLAFGANLFGDLSVNGSVVQERGVPKGDAAGKRRTASLPA